MNKILPDVIASEPVERKFLKCVKSGDVAGYDYSAQLADAQEKGYISASERELLERVRHDTFEFISVDDFSTEEMAAGRRQPQPKQPALRSVAKG